MDVHLYIDTAARKLVRGLQDKGKPDPFEFFQGDTLNVFLHGRKPNPNTDSLDPYVADPIAFTKIKFGIGFGPDAAPKGGTSRLRVKGTPQTTPALAFNVTKEAFAAELNALPSVTAIDPAGIRLDPTEKPNFFLIRWANQAITAQFEFVENRLEPFSFTRSTIAPLPGGQAQLLKYFVAPFAFTDQFYYPAAAPVQVASVRSGNGTRNCVQSITVPPNAVGTFDLKFAGNATEILSVQAVKLQTDGSTTLQTALNDLYSDGQTRFLVTRQDYGLYYVEYTGPLEKQDFALLAVTMHEQAPEDTPTAQLALDAPSLEFALGGQAKAKFILELEISNGNKVGTPIQQEITIINDMLDSEMAIAADPAWLQSIRNPVAYPDYDPSPAANIIGQQFYIQVVGQPDGSANAFVLTHNLGTLNCHVTTRENGGENLLIPHNEYETVYLDQNRIRVDFGRPVLPNEFVVIISTSAENAQWLQHTHPIGDIEGLQEILDALSATGNPLDLWPSVPDSKLPAHIGWKTPDGNAYRFDKVPDDLLDDNIPRLEMPGKRLPLANLPLGVPYIDPSTGELVVTYLGPPPHTVVLLDKDGHLPVGILPLDPSGWPGLLSAILKALQSGATMPNLVVIQIDDYAEQFPPAFELENHCPNDNTVSRVPASIMPAAFNTPLAGTLSDALPLPNHPAVAGKRFTVAGSANSAADVFRERQKFADGQQIVSNGRHWYAVATQGNVAYPAEYDRELFAFHVSADMLAPGSRFALDFTLQAQFQSADDIRAQYILTLEIGTPRGATGPGVGTNLADVDWYGTVIQKTLILSSATVPHRFAYAVTRPAPTNANANPALLASKTLYVTEGLPAVIPTAAGFAVRARLSCFDVEDAISNPAGQIVLKMARATASIAKANS